MARRSINDAAKVFLAAFVLGPPIGGVAFMALLQVVPWFATGFTAPAPQVGALFKSLLLMVPLSYFVGGMAAGLAGLALAAYFAWGGRITVWACLAAALIYPALLAVTGAIAVRDSPQSMPPVLLNAAMIAIASVSAALVCYLLLRNTRLVQGSGDRTQGIPS
ncbi:MAG: hypothetical protein ABI457_02630 [Hyphomicrobium sp.]